MVDQNDSEKTVVQGPWPERQDVINRRRNDAVRDKQIADGAAVIKALEISDKLSMEDAEMLAVRIYEQMPRDKIELRNVVKQFAEIRGWDFVMAQKESYVLTLKPGHRAVKNDCETGKGKKSKRLRVDRRRYLDLIKAIVVATSKKEDDINERTQLLADHVAFGTTLHPVDPATAAGAEDLCRRLQEIADAIDKRFGLLEQFLKLADYKVNLYRSAGMKDRYSENFWGLTDVVKEQDLNDWRHAVIWGTVEECGYGVGCEANLPSGWCDLSGYVPCTPLGFDAEFDFDRDYWPVPKEWWGRFGNSWYHDSFAAGATDDMVDIYSARVEWRLKLFSTLDMNRLESLRWAGSDQAACLSFGGYESVDDVNEKLAQYRKDWLDWAKSDEGPDIPSMYWLFLYPSQSLDRLVPVVAHWMCNNLILRVLSPAMLNEDEYSCKVLMYLNKKSDGNEIVLESIAERIGRGLMMDRSKDGWCSCEIGRNFLASAGHLLHEPHMHAIGKRRIQQEMHQQMVRAIANGEWPESDAGI